MKKYTCKYCGLEFIGHKALGGHSAHCSLNLKNKERNGGLKFHSEETKKILSEKRKAYLAANKDKHNWSRYSNSESVPETKFREFAERSNLKLDQYYIPPESDRFFEIDFANLEHKVAFEINGNQHYNRDGTLKDYYKKRQEHFIRLGWKPVEIHYSLCFNEDALSDIIRLSFSDFALCKDKIQEIGDARIERKFQKQREEILLKKQRKMLPRRYKRKVVRPSKEELHKMLWEMPTSKIAKQFGVSDSAVGKWAKSYGISKPPRGYWAKLKSNKVK